MQYRALRAQLPKIAAEIAINEFKDNWRRQGYRTNTGVVKWAPRKHNKSSRAILVGKGSGRLRRDFANRSSREMARVVNKSPYGRVHNEGLALRGNELVQDGFTKSGRPRFKRTNTPAKMTERPFMKHNSYIEKDIEKEYYKSIDDILKTV